MVLYSKLSCNSVENLKCLIPTTSTESVDTWHAHIECTEDMDRVCRLQSNNHDKCGVCMFYSSFGMVCVHVLSAREEPLNLILLI